MFILNLIIAILSCIFYILASVASTVADRENKETSVAAFIFGIVCVFLVCACTSFNPFTHIAQLIPYAIAYGILGAVYMSYRLLSLVFVFRSMVDEIKNGADKDLKASKFYDGYTEEEKTNTFWAKVECLYRSNGFLVHAIMSKEDNELRSGITLDLKRYPLFGWFALWPFLICSFIVDLYNKLSVLFSNLFKWVESLISVK